MEQTIASRGRRRMRRGRRASSQALPALQNQNHQQANPMRESEAIGVSWATHRGDGIAKRGKSVCVLRASARLSCPPPSATRLCSTTR